MKSTKGAKSPTKTPQSHDDNEYYHFKPIVKLPENVTVKTGEEEEDLLLCERAKLFKFSGEEWKERGVGDIKLLRNWESKRVRILMRRDQVLKICLNHYVRKDCELKAMKNTNGKAWVWYADDFTREGEVEHSQFAIKFKTVEIADKFKASFDKAKTGEGEVIEAPKTPQTRTRSRKSTSESEARKSVSESKVASLQKTPESTSSQKKLASSAPTSFTSILVTPTSGTGLFETYGIGSALTKDKPADEKTSDKPTASGETKPASSGFTNGDTKNTGFTLGQSSVSSTTADKPKPAFSFSGQVNFSFSEAQPKDSTLSKPAFTFTEPKDTTPVKAAAPCETQSKPDSTTGFAFTFSGVTPMKSTKGAKSPTKTPQSHDDNEYYHDDDEDERIYFKPIVNLPENVTVKTGEEEEDLLFCERAKLFKFSGEEWKERGVGDVKLLRDWESKRVRILMRRDQVFKICLNHYVRKDCELKPMKNTNGKAWVWYADDFTQEGEVEHSQFAIKFKTVEIADKFKASFDKAKTGEGEVIEAPKTPQTRTRSRKSTSESEAKKSVSESKVASVQKTPESTSSHKALASSAPTSFTSILATPTSGTGLFETYGIGSALTKDKPADEKTSDKPTASLETKPASSGFTFGDSKNTGFTLGQSSVSSTTADKPKPAFSFSGQINFSFSEAQPKDSTPLKPAFTFTEPKDTTPVKAAAPCETPSKPDLTTGFAFTFSGVTPVKSTKGAKSPTKTPQSHDDNEYNHDDDEGERIYFKPIVNLPENVTVKTGEEEEDLLLSKRAKLFKFSGEEWKERGVGNVKLLRDWESKRVRILMRRDKVFKICLNHYVRKDCELKPMKNTNGKAWVWYADDFTQEGEVEHSQFAIKFKTVEIADKFKASFDKAKTGEGEVIEAPKTPQTRTRSRKSTSESEARKSVSESKVASVQKTRESTSSHKALASSAPTSFTSILATPTSGTGLFETYGIGSALTKDKPADEKTSDKPTASLETKPASSGFAFGDSKNTGFTFGQSSVSSTTADKPKPAFSFSGEVNFSFSEAQPKDNTPSKPAFTFTEPKDITPVKAAAPCETPSKPNLTTGFAFTFSDVIPVKSTKGAKSTKTPQSHDDNEYYHDDEGERIYFKPIVNLPENVTVKTGEEEEDLLLCERAKLFKFSGEEWKERGVGDVKLLSDRESKRVRILMRRDQVFKICLNHYVRKDCELKPMKNTNGKAWVWYADDFTQEGEVEHSQFAIKFKTVEIADKFKASFDTAKTGEDEVTDAPKTPQTRTRSRKSFSESEARKSVSESEVTSSQKTPELTSSQETLASSAPTSSTSVLATPKFGDTSFGSVTSTPSSGVLKFGASESSGGTGLFGSQPTQPTHSMGLFGSSPAGG